MKQDKKTFKIAFNDFFDWELGDDFQNRHESVNVFIEEINTSNRTTELIRKFEVSMYKTPEFWLRFFQDVAPRDTYVEQQFVSGIIEKIQKEDPEAISKLINTLPYDELIKFNNPLRLEKLSKFLFESDVIKNTYTALFFQTYLNNKKIMGKLRSNHKGGDVCWFDVQDEKNRKEPTSLTNLTKLTNLTNVDNVANVNHEAPLYEAYEAFNWTKTQYEDNVATFLRLVNHSPLYHHLFNFDREQSVENFVRDFYGKSYPTELSAINVPDSLIKSAGYGSYNLYEIRNLSKDEVYMGLIDPEYVKKNATELIERILPLDSERHASPIFITYVTKFVPAPSATLDVLLERSLTVLDRLSTEAPDSDLTKKYKKENVKSAICKTLSCCVNQWKEVLTQAHLDKIKNIMKKDKSIFLDFYSSFERIHGFREMFEQKSDVIEMSNLLSWSVGNILKERHYLKIDEHEISDYIQKYIIDQGADLKNHPNLPKGWLEKKYWIDLEFSKANQDHMKNSYQLEFKAKLYEKIATSTGIFKDPQFAARVIEEKNYAAICVCFEYKKIRTHKELLKKYLMLNTSHCAVLNRKESEPELGAYFSNKELMTEVIEKNPSMMAHVSAELWADVGFIEKMIPVFDAEDQCAQWVPINIRHHIKNVMQVIKEEKNMTSSRKSEKSADGPKKNKF